MGRSGRRQTALRMSSVAIRLALILALAAAWLAWPVEKSHACSCAYPGTPSEALERSAAVFAGQVVSIEHGNNRGGLDSVTVEFHVSTVWKGPSEQTIRMKSPGAHNSCHVPFQVGVEYLVYSLHGLEVNWCSPVRPLSEAAGDLAELGPGRAPSEGVPDATPVVPGQPAGGGCSASPGVDVLPLLGLVAGIALLGIRKRLLGEK